MLAEAGCVFSTAMSPPLVLFLFFRCFGNLIKDFTSSASNAVYFLFLYIQCQNNEDKESIYFSLIHRLF